MTTPRPHAELADRYFADVTLKCWARDKDSNDKWDLLHSPLFISQDVEYYVGHEPPPPIKRTITLTVNGREWVLPEPFRNEPEKGTAYWTDTPAGVTGYTWRGDAIDKIYFMGQRTHATEAECQAWADFDKWCRGGSR